MPLLDHAHILYIFLDQFYRRCYCLSTHVTLYPYFLNRFTHILDLLLFTSTVLPSVYQSTCWSPTTPPSLSTYTGRSRSSLESQLLLSIDIWVRGWPLFLLPLQLNIKIFLHFGCIGCLFLNAYLSVCVTKSSVRLPFFLSACMSSRLSDIQ